MNSSTKTDIIIFIPYFLPDDSYGGPIVSINSLITKIKYRKRIFIYTTSLLFNDQKIISTNKIPNKFIFKITRSKSHFKNFLNTFLILLKSKKRTIYINSFFYTPNSIPFFLLSHFLIRNNNKLIISPRGELEKSKIESKKKILKNILIFLFKKISSPKIIFLSSSESEMLNNINYFKKNKQISIPNLPRFNKFLVRKKLKSKRLKIIFFSRISEEKGLHFFLKGLEEYNIKIPIDLTILGSSHKKNYFKTIKNLCYELSKKDYIIKILGHKSITQNFLSKHDVMILPSMGENYSHTIVEASQSGLFCLISNKTPWFKKTKSAENGLTFLTPDNSLGYIDSIKKIIKLDDQEFKALIDEQQSEVKSILESTARKMEDFFIN